MWDKGRDIMIPYTDFKPGKILVFNKQRQGKTSTYSDNIFTLDTETSTYYKHPDGWGEFDYTKPRIIMRRLKK